MARKIVRQNRFQLGDLRAAEEDIFQSGCEAAVRYQDSDYFPAKSVRYYMLCELSNICWETRWYGKRTPKQLPATTLDHVDETRLQGVSVEDHADARLKLGTLIDAARHSDKHCRTRHTRTLQLVALHGIGVKGERLGLHGIKPDTYGYACRSLKRFAQQILKEAV